MRQNLLYTHREMADGRVVEEIDLDSIKHNIRVIHINSINLIHPDKYK